MLDSFKSCKVLLVLPDSYSTKILSPIRQLSGELASRRGSVYARRQVSKEEQPDCQSGVWHRCYYNTMSCGPLFVASSGRDEMRPNERGLNESQFNGCAGHPSSHFRVCWKDKTRRRVSSPANCSLLSCTIPQK